MSTAQQLIDSIRDRMADSSDVAYTAAAIIRHANDGARQFAATTGCMQESFAFTMDGNSSYITFARITTDTGHKPVTVFAVNCPSRLDFAPLYETVGWPVYWVGMTDVSTSGQPTAWTLWGEVVRFDIKPAANMVAAAYYTRIPAEMTAVDSVFDFPAQWEQAIKSYVRFCLHDTDRESGLADRAFAEYEADRQAAFAHTQAQIGGGYAK